MTAPDTIQQTSLFPLHQANSAKIVPFAGYEMPVNYAPGIIKEHLHTRAHAGLFDVSHMGQIRITGDDIAAKLETLIPIDLLGLKPWRQKYGLFLNDQGGIIDDLMVMHCDDHFMLVVNAACKQKDFKLLQNKLGEVLHIEMLEQQSLLALQGPDAVKVLTEHGAAASDMKFMDVSTLKINDIPCLGSRSGYTGEDGFELSVHSDQAMPLASALLQHHSVELVGLGARDSLRMEAGLCLYGQDLDVQTTPIEAGLKWAISPARRSSGPRPGGFPGSDKILSQIDSGAGEKLVGLTPQGRAPMRSGTSLFDQQKKPVGTITSGGYSPSLGHPISMGYINTELSESGTELLAEIRGKYLPVEVTPLPFVPHQYAR